MNNAWCASIVDPVRTAPAATPWADVLNLLQLSRHRFPIGKYSKALGTPGEVAWHNRIPVRFGFQVVRNRTRVEGRRAMSFNTLTLATILTR
jgi:hypothetical protein